jgi:hypothetical protein
MTFDHAESVYDPNRDECLVDAFLIARSGFLQHKGSAGSGVAKIAGMLDYHFGGERFSREAGRNVRTRVEMEAWNDCPDQTAEMIYRLGTKEQKPTIGYFGYSWGCGYGFVQFARALQRLGLDIDHAVLCDPVYHGVFKWRAFMPRTLFHQIYVSVPANVKRVSRFYQRIDKPAGHDLKLEGRYTRTVRDVELFVGHCDIDDADEFQRECFDVAARLVN